MAVLGRNSFNLPELDVHQGYVQESEVKLYLFYTSTVDDCASSASHSGCLIPGEWSPSYLIKTWGVLDW
jgi:hypothetical protein